MIKLCRLLVGFVCVCVWETGVFCSGVRWFGGCYCFSWVFGCFVALNFGVDCIYCIWSFVGVYLLGVCVLTFLVFTGWLQFSWWVWVLVVSFVPLWFVNLFVLHLGLMLIVLLDWWFL